MEIRPRAKKRKSQVVINKNSFYLASGQFGFQSKLFVFLLPTVVVHIVQCFWLGCQLHAAFGDKNSTTQLACTGTMGDEN
jgi:hypothetical protein